MQKPYIKIFSLLLFLSALSAVEHQVINPAAKVEDQVSEISFQFGSITKKVTVPAGDVAEVLAELEGFIQVGPALLVNPAQVQFVEATPVNASIARLHFQFAGYTTTVEATNAEAEALLDSFTPADEAPTSNASA